MNPFNRRFLPLELFCLVSSLLVGCATTASSDTSRTGMEQLLISNAVDKSLNKIDFDTLRGKKVFVEEKYIDCTDKNYVVSSVRHRVLHGGCKLVGKPEDADVVMEIRSGGVGTDRTDKFVGMPKLALPGPMPISIPEIKLWSKVTQTGIAKIGVVAYDTKSQVAYGDGGLTMARSDDTNTFFFGVGPWQSGTVRGEVSDSLSVGERQAPLPKSVAFSEPKIPFSSPDSSSRVRMAGNEEAAAAPVQNADATDDDLFGP